MFSAPSSTVLPNMGVSHERLQTGFVAIATRKLLVVCSCYNDRVGGAPPIYHEKFIFLSHLVASQHQKIDVADRCHFLDVTHFMTFMHSLMAPVSTYRFRLSAD